MKITWDIYQYKPIPKDIFGTTSEKGLLSFLAEHNGEWSGRGGKTLLKT